MESKQMAQVEWEKENGKTIYKQQRKKKATEFVSVHSWVCEAEFWKFSPLTAEKMAFVNRIHSRTVAFGGGRKGKEWKERNCFCMQAKDFQIALHFVALDGIH